MKNKRCRDLGVGNEREFTSSMVSNRYLYQIHTMVVVVEKVHIEHSLVTRGFVIGPVLFNSR